MNLFRSLDKKLKNSHCCFKTVLSNKAMRLPEIFDFRLFTIVESQRFSTTESDPKQNRGFERPKLSQNLTKLLPKIRFETPVRKYTGIFGIFENTSQKDRNFCNGRNFRNRRVYEKT